MVELIIETNGKKGIINIIKTNKGKK